jgi:hypothetical protein
VLLIPLTNVLLAADWQSGGQVRNVGWSLAISAEQGSSLSLGSGAPQTTMPMQGFAFFFNGFQSPFVTGFVPFVAAQPVSPVRLRWQQLQQERWLSSRSANRPAAAAQSAATAQPVLRRTAVRTRPDDPPLVLK